MENKSIVIELTVAPAIETDGWRHTGTSYLLGKTPEFDQMVLNEINSPQLTSYEFEYALGHTETLFFKSKYHFTKYDDNGDIIIGEDGKPVKKESATGQIISLRGQQSGPTLSGNIIATPIVSVSVDYTRNNDGEVVIKNIPMRNHSGVGKHKANSYRIKSGLDEIIFKREYDEDNLSELRLPLYKFENNSIYEIAVKHHSTTNNESLYGIEYLNLISKESAIFDLIPNYNCLFTINKFMYFQLKLFVPGFLSIDLIIVDEQGNVVAKALPQHTSSPRIFTGGLSPDKIYLIKARVRLNTGYTNYKTVYRGKPRVNSLINFNNAWEYPGKYTYTHIIETDGSIEASSCELCDGTILLGEHNSTALYSYKLGPNNVMNRVRKLYEFSKVDINSVVGEPTMNIIPLHNGNLLVDYASNSVDSEFRHPTFTTFDYNPISGKITKLKEIKRDDELYSTAVSSSACAMMNRSVYYIPSVIVDANGVKQPLVLKRLLLANENPEIITVKALPVPVTRFVSLVKLDEENLLMIGGVTNEDVDDINNDDLWFRTNNMIYRFNIVENKWYEETVLSNLIISRVYNLAAYMRRDRKIVIFNNTDNIAERNNQSTVVYDFINKEFTYEDNDHADNVAYRTTVVSKRGDIYRISAREQSTQKVYRYISGGEAVPVVDNSLIDTEGDLIIGLSKTVHVDAPERYDSFYIQPGYLYNGEKALNSGILAIKINENKEFILRHNDVVITKDTVIEQDLFKGYYKFDSLTLLNDATLTINNIVIVPDNVTFELIAPVILSRIVLGKNSILIIKNSTGDVVSEYSGGTDGIEFN